MKLPTFWSGTAVYLLSNIANAAIPFALLPILTRHLTPSEYGEVAMFQTLLGALGAIVGSGIVAASARKFYDGDRNTEELRVFVAACLRVLAMSTALVFLLVLLFSGQLSKAFSLDRQWLALAVIAAALTVVVQLRLSLWQVQQRPVAFGALQVSQSLVSMVLSVVLVVAFAQGAAGRINAQIFVAVAFALVAAMLLRSDGLLAIGTTRKAVREALAFGMPLIPHEAGLFLLGSVDRIIVNAQLGLHETGLYTVAVQIAGALGLVLASIQNAYVPWLFERLKRGTHEEIVSIVRQTYRWFGVLVAIAAGAFLLGPSVVPMIAGEQYAQAGRIIGLLVLGQAFNGMYLMVTAYVFYGKRTGLLAVSTISAGALNVMLLIALSKWFGLEGAAAAYAFSMAIRFIVTWFIAQRSHPMPWFR